MLYNRSGDQDLLSLAELLRQPGHKGNLQFENFEYKEKTSVKELGLAERKPEIAMQTHGRKQCDGTQVLRRWWVSSNDSSERAGVERQLATLDMNRGMPTGTFSADEHFAGKNPSQGVELYAVVETMFSLEYAISILGNAALGDWIQVEHS